MNDSRILRLLHALADRLSPDVDRERVLDVIERLSKCLIDDSAQYALLKTVDTYRLVKWHEESDDEAIERQTLADLRQMSRQRWNERTALLQQVRADILAGRMTLVAAIERIALPAWTALCSTISDDDLRRVLGGEP